MEAARRVESGPRGERLVFRKAQALDRSRSWPPARRSGSAQRGTRRGTPYVELVGLVEHQRAELAVIGFAPTGVLSGFLIREESEEVINRLECSILAIKPEGFVSPVS